MPNYLPTNLTFLRKLFKVTQDSLASQLIKGQSTVGNWENNVSTPSTDDLLSIKQFFGISLDNLIETDLRNVQVSKLTEIIKKQGFVQGTVQGYVQGKVKQNTIYEDRDGFRSMVNEDEPAKEWATMKILKEMDAKLDRLLLSAGNTPDKSTP